jgi:OmpR family response regulator RpaB
MKLKTLFNYSKKKEPSLILVKIISGEELTFCREVKKISTIPIMGITALKGISERLQILEVVDDYLIHPFYLKELGARIKSLLRRYRLSPARSQKFIQDEGRVIEAGNISINTSKRQVFKNQNLVPLTYFEYKLLELLITNAGKPLDRSFILSEIWKYTPERHADTRVIDVHIARLRKKIEENPSAPLLILTARGVGYMFQNGASAK